MDPLRQAELSEQNLSTWTNTNTKSSSGVLDTSLKKNTSFVKKIPTSITKDRYQSILNEIATLSLNKYETEIIISVQEAILKNGVKVADIPAFVEVISALHQKFYVPNTSCFTTVLMSWFLGYFANPLPLLNSLDPKEERQKEKERVTRFRGLFRLFMELYIVKIFRTVEDLSNVGEEFPGFISKSLRTNAESGNDQDLIMIILKECLSYKMKQGITLSIATSFVKRYNESYIQTHASLQNMLKSYSEAVTIRAKSIQEKVQDLIIKRNKAQIRTGKVNEEWEVALAESSEIYECFKSACEVLCPAFGLTMPDLSIKDTNEQENEDSVIVSKDSTIWSSDEEKRFYTVFPVIPEELIQAAKEDTDANKANDMNELLASLDIASSNSEIDACVMQFWEAKLTNKASVNRLMRHMTSNRDFGRAKVYARFLKSNESFLAEVISELMGQLDQSFRSQIYHNGLNLRNIIFFSEMIKFQLVPTHVVFHKIRSLILSLTTPNNIEILTIFFETSGKLLLATQSVLMEEMLALLQEKRKSDKLSPTNRLAIANLFLLLKPPSVKSLRPKTPLTPEQQFLKILIRKELTPSNYQDVSSIINLADMADEKQAATLLKLFTKPDKISYENIPALTHILRSFPSRSFRISVIDTTVDQIITGMESNDYRMNRIRVAQVKYLSDIYLRKLIPLDVVLKVIYKLLSFGHALGYPYPPQAGNAPQGSFESELDSSDDYFRIQLLTVILTAIHPGLNQRSKKQMAKFKEVFIFFDYYIWCKIRPLPMEFEFKVRKCYELFRFEGVKSDENGGVKAAMDNLKALFESKKGAVGVVDDEEDDDDEGEEGSDSDSDSDQEETSDSEYVNEEGEEEKIDQEKEAQSAYELYERKLQLEEEKKLESQLEREFKKMVFDSMNASKGNVNDSNSSSSTSNTLNKAIGTVELPSESSSSSTASSQISLPSLSGSPALAPSIQDTNKVKFRLITKQGKVATSRELNLPSDVRFASNILEEEKRRTQEKEKINKYILGRRFDDEQDEIVRISVYDRENTGAAKGGN
ncbi:hypothetical protein WICPIJ_000182 [Wickerhamomyces pijperi]|uniref:MIF4G domain-containing protein n=1 Tax=Wickerhamomyces pijperi TaxID=599730 RepID=A0A9P8QE69_WICPI|nr:hypothetical protein WICPIJ_000182 [Wickerhamomyces pijperi]